jgi:uncharacterized protein YbjT (DUF2867 family)
LSEGLVTRGAKVRALARTAGRLQELERRGAEIRAGSLTDPAFLAAAFAGAAAAFVMIPPDYTTADHHAYQRATAGRLVAALRQARVPRVVDLSSVGAELPAGTGPIAGLHVLEEGLNAIPGIHVVHLRASYFMENHLGSIGLIKSAGINGSSMKADLPLPMIATRDIAHAAVECLAKPTFTGRSVRYLLGPRDYTPAEATRILGAAGGKPDLKYVEFPYEDTQKALASHGFSEDVARLFVEMQRAFNEGTIRTEARSVANTTPTTLEEFARSVFAPAFSG